MKSVLQKPFPNLIPIILISLMGWQSCFVTHSNTKTESNSDSPTVTPKIIFLDYSVKPDKSTGALEILLINKIVTEGKLKINNVQQAILKPGDLKCMTLDNRMNPLDSIIVTDPLNVTVESVNEKNELFKKEIKKDSAQFSIRLQLTEKIFAVGIKKNSNSDNQNSYLVITKLQ
jgi:hypothetical protein